MYYKALLKLKNKEKIITLISDIIPYITTIDPKITFKFIKKLKKHKWSCNLYYEEI